MFTKLSQFITLHHQTIIMKFILALAFIGLVAAQRAKSDPKDIQLVRSEAENNGDGTYSFRYELTDGTIVEEKGYLKAPLPGTTDPIQVAEGSFQYVSPEGENIKVDYRADEGGFQPTGSHLPTPPPIPEEIKKALEIIYKNAADQAKSPQRQ